VLVLVTGVWLARIPMDEHRTNQASGSGFELKTGEATIADAARNAL
jgi:hypothetical protein